MKIVFDGDLVLVVDEPVMMSGVNRDVPITIDIEDKITALSEEYNLDNIAKLIMRSFDNRIGDYSNYATCYHNMNTKSQEQKDKYSNYVSILSVATGKEIDKAKTGVSFSLPRHIVAYAGKLPYFMKYASPYYKTLKDFNKNQSNMNRMCYEIESWEKDIKIAKQKGFNYQIMIDSSIEYTEEEYSLVESIYSDFNVEITQMKRDQYKFNNYEKYRDWIWENYQFTKYEASNFSFDWGYYYEIYRKRCAEAIPNQNKLANIVVDLCYRKYSKRSKNFIWIVAGDGIVGNIHQVQMKLPLRDKDGDVDILGKKYKMIDFLYLD